MNRLNANRSLNLASLLNGSSVVSLMAVMLVASLSLADGGSEPSISKLRVSMHAIAFQRFSSATESALCSDITGLDLKSFDRNIIELAIVCRALTIQGHDPVVDLIPAPNYGRAVRMVEEGIVHTVSESIWSRDVSDQVFGTVDTLRIGEFEKGIYVYDSHDLLAKPFSKRDLRQYTGLTYKNWHYDWDIIASLTDKQLPVVKRSSLFSMLAANRADFTLWEFSSKPNLEARYANTVLKPIPNVKVIVPDSRKFIVSRSISDGEKVYTLLNQGLMKMRDAGEIVDFYKNGGFMNTRTASWRVINSEDWQIIDR